MQYTGSKAGHFNASGRQLNKTVLQRLRQDCPYGGAKSKGMKLWRQRSSVISILQTCFIEKRVTIAITCNFKICQFGS